MAGRVGIAKSELVAQALEREIRQGHFAHGDQLESEGNLMQRFWLESQGETEINLESFAVQGEAA